MCNYTLHITRVSACPSDTIISRILSYRKQNLLNSTKGFGQQGFNIFCKYNNINICHGIFPEKLNPLRSIKKIIMSADLQKNLEAGPAQICSFTTNFLSNLFTYTKNYQLVSTSLTIQAFRTIQKST